MMNVGLYNGRIGTEFTGCQNRFFLALLQQSGVDVFNDLVSVAFASIDERGRGGIVSSMAIQ